MSILDGWIDEVEDGLIYGRVFYGGEELEFSLPLLSVLEGQRVDLQPGSYVSFTNGYLAINSTIWTTRDMEAADREAKRLHRALVGSVSTPEVKP